jgi:hypothetical protein
MFEEVQQMIPELLKKAIQEQLKTSRTHKTFSRNFNGTNKTVGGTYGPFNSAPISTGTLYRSVNVYWEKDVEDGDPNLIVDFGEADWWYWVDLGRKPGKFPNITALTKWVKDKPIGQFRDSKGRFISRDSQVYLIGRSIKEYGYGGTNFMEKAWESLRDDFESNEGPLADYIFEYIDSLIAEGRILGISKFNR